MRLVAIFFAKKMKTAITKIPKIPVRILKKIEEDAALATPGEKEIFNGLLGNCSRWFSIQRRSWQITTPCGFDESVGVMDKSSY